MPEIKQPERLEPINLDVLPFIWHDDPIGARAAQELVIRTFTEAESRRQWTERKWVDADNLYWGHVPIRYWEGSKVERSRIPNNIAMDHVEGAHAAIGAALFDNPEWFSVEAMDQTDPRDAREMQAGLQYYLDLPDRERFTDTQSELDRMIKSSLQYGSGFGRLEWKGSYPSLRWVNKYDVYPDPGATSPIVDDWRFCCIRNPEVTVEQINNLRNDKRVRVPDDDVLNALRLGSPIQSFSDRWKVYSDMVRGISTFNVETIQLPMPSQNRLEILEYYDKGRIIWVLNRMLPILIMENPYKFLPIIHMPCRFIEGRALGFGLPESIQYPQRYSEAMLNNHIDNKYLQQNPPMAMNKNLSAESDRYFRPGQRWHTQNKDDIQIFPPSVSEQNVWAEVQYFETLASRRNGFNELALGGQASKPGSVRTAAGVQAQMQGSNVRLKQIVTNIERYALGPLLSKTTEMIKYHTMPSDILLGSYPSSDGSTQYRPIRAEVFHRPVRYMIRAASKMLTRDRLGPIAEFTGRMLINGPIQDGLAKQHKKINYEEWANMCQDAGGLPKRYQLVVDMTPEEIQASQAPPPDVQAKMQVEQGKQQMEGQRMQLDWAKSQLDSQTELQKAQISKQADPMEAQIKAQEAQQEFQLKQALAGVEIETKRQQAQMDMAKKQSELQIQREKLQVQRQGMEQQNQQNLLSHILGLQQSQQSHAQQMQQQREKQQLAAQAPSPNRKPR